MSTKSAGSTRNVSEVLHLGRVHDTELLVVLLDFFKRANWVSPSVQRFGTDETSSYVDVSVDKNGAIDLLNSPLGDLELNTVSDHIRTILIDGQKEVVGQALSLPPFPAWFFLSLRAAARKNKPGR